MGGPQTRVNVNVRAERAPDGSIEWNPTISFHPPGNGNANGDKIHLTAQGGAEILFDLDDRSGMHLRFRSDPNDAIWIVGGVNCPGGQGTGDGQFSIDRVQNTRLTITDFHTDQNEYCYALRFDSDNGVQQWDPIIKN